MHIFYFYSMDNVKEQPPIVLYLHTYLFIIQYNIIFYKEFGWTCLLVQWQQRLSILFYSNNKAIQRSQPEWVTTMSHNNKTVRRSQPERVS